MLLFICTVIAVCSFILGACCMGIVGKVTLRMTKIRELEARLSQYEEVDEFIL